MSEKKIDVKIGTPEESFWTQVKKEAQSTIEGLQKGLKYNQAVLEMAESKMKKAKK
jgi:hypothetical protein